MSIMSAAVVVLRALLMPRGVIIVEKLARRHQLGVLRRSAKRPMLRRWDRILWVWLSRLWSGRRSSLMIVKPETVIKWPRQGFRLYWRWKSRKKMGRPAIPADIRTLIRRMACENPTWGAPRIQSELHLLGYTVAEMNPQLQHFQEDNSPGHAEPADSPDLPSRGAHPGDHFQ